MKMKPLFVLAMLFAMGFEQVHAEAISPEYTPSDDDGSGYSKLYGADPNQGNFKFRYPIETGVARAGHVPEVAVSYRSNASYGEFGHGMRLTRNLIYKKPGYALETRPYMLELDDEVFELTEISPNIFKPRINTYFLEIEKQNDDTFVARSPDGETRTYSRLTGDFYALQAHKNRYGDLIEYSYDGLLLKELRYGGRENVQTHTKKISISWGNIPGFGNTTFSIAGLFYGQRITGISVYSEDTLRRSYSFAYSSSNRLLSITTDEARVLRLEYYAQEGDPRAWNPQEEGRTRTFPRELTPLQRREWDEMKRGIPSDVLMLELNGDGLLDYIDMEGRAFLRKPDMSFERTPLWDIPSRIADYYLYWRDGNRALKRDMGFALNGSSPISISGDGRHSLLIFGRFLRNNG
ncbi:MAG: hypothetical protein HQK54_09925, partial [Oligoflexales bacterium]|nr:hypothetical protein [Oligoflexales bacterium]